MNHRSWLGLVFLLALSLAGSWLWGRVPGGEDLIARLWLHASATPEAVSVHFDGPAPTLQAGDPVYSQSGESFNLIGRVSSLNTTANGSELIFALDPSRRNLLRHNARGLAMNPKGDLGWMLRTLLPPDARQALLRDLQQVWERQQKETLGDLRPQLLSLLSDLTEILRDTLPAALEAEKESGDAFLAALREEFWKEKLRPVMQEHFFPVLEKRMTTAAEPIAKEIGDSIREHGVFGVISAFSMNKVWLMSDEATANKLKELLTATAFPVLKRRAPELAKAALDAVIEAANRPEIQDALNRAAWDLVNHPDFQRWSEALVNRWIIKNDRLVARLRQALEDQRIRKPVQRLSAEMEPILMKHLEEVLSREDRQGMDHRLVRVLRRLVLWKDQRYLLLDLGSGPAFGGETLPGRLGFDL